LFCKFEGKLSGIYNVKC